MSKPEKPVALVAAELEPRAMPTNYPADLAAKVAGRRKRILGDLFGLTNSGVNLTSLAPGAQSSLRHAHARQDEFVYILAGYPTFITDAGEAPLMPGMVAGFKAGTGDAHCLVNRGSEEVWYLEVADRSPGDSARYPYNDLAVTMGEDGQYRYTRKNGTPI
jgi:uncharacterized cupin superfamily protein